MNKFRIVNAIGMLQRYYTGSATCYPMTKFLICAKLHICPFSYSLTNKGGDFWTLLDRKAALQNPPTYNTRNW
jgi:hypothetical protein